MTLVGSITENPMTATCNSLEDGTEMSTGRSRRRSGNRQCDMGLKLWA